MNTSLTLFAAVRLAAVFALVAALAVPAAVLASGYGAMGLYADSDATVNQIEASGGMLPLYLVASDPADDFGHAPDSITGFEGSIDFQSPSDFVMQVDFPVEVINVGSNDNLIVGFGSPLPLSGSSVVLATVVIYTQGQPESNVYLRPAEPASVPGYLAVVDQDFQLVPMEPASGDSERPVFFINSNGFLQNASWGTAKILYR